VNGALNPVFVIFTLIFMSGFYGCDQHDGNLNNAKATVTRSFHKPLDGKLTEQQVADYIAIRKKIIADVKAQKLVQKKAIEKNEHHESADAEVRHFDEIEMAAASSLEMSYKEFQWIKDTVIDTRTKMLLQQYYRLNHKILTLLDNTLTRYKEINGKTSEQQEQQTMNGYVAEIKQEIANLRSKMTDPDDRSEALEHNIVIISKYKKELESLQ
jgi:hypothetical protein